MTTNRLEQFFLGTGRIPRVTWVYRIVIAAAICAAFGSLFITLVGDWGAGIFAGIFLLCSCAQSVQRLHDVGRTGYALLVGIVPIIGPLWLITQLLKRGVEGRNRFGDNPLSRNGYLTVTISL
jgi:uncharacterized membrane protein YhaH (DUF805 family)